MRHKKMTLPPVNTPVWVVTEHFYYIPGKAAPRREFTVCNGYVLRHNTLPRCEPEAVISFQSADGIECLLFVRRSRLRYNCFETPREAAARAKALTEKFESSCLSRMFHETMRRPWKKYLMEE